MTNNRFELHKRIFLRTSIPYGLILTVFLVIIYVIKTGGMERINMILVIGASGGVIYGLYMSCVLIYMHLRSVRKIRKISPRMELDVRQVRKIVLSIPYIRAYDLCIESLGSLKKCKISDGNHVKGEITAKTGISMKSFGEEISIHIKTVDTYKTMVLISSRPTMVEQLVDYGKNLDNVEKICAFLKVHEPNADIIDIEPTEIQNFFI